MQEMQGVVRGLADNFIYHIINRGNGRQEVFHKEKDYEAFIEIMKEAKERHPVKLLSYCLMPNHFHMRLLQKSWKCYPEQSEGTRNPLII
jgi:putative transposase